MPSVRIWTPESDYDRDADSEKSKSQRRKEKNSLFNRIQSVVESSGGRAKLILMLQELEAWLLVDCLGICCYFTKNHQTRSNQEWIEFAKRKQPGKTSLIEEAELGGKNAKEYLIDLSREILIKINPKLRNKPRNLKERQYCEDQAPEIANCIEINKQTIRINESLEEFAECLKQLTETE